MIKDDDGLLLCARYAIAPNFLGYCGPRKSLSLIDHLKEKIIDEEVKDILSLFETMTPYLNLIARKNQIPSIFNKEVVEAYWLGNRLLQPLTSFEFKTFAYEKLFLEKRVGEKGFISIIKKLYQKKIGKNFSSFLPHHAFHVFNIFQRTGATNSLHTLETMDHCRIGWGKVIIRNKKIKLKDLLVEAKPLLLKDDKLVLGKSMIKKIKIDYRGKNFIDDLEVGDWVSFHWDFLCDKLTPRQRKNLEYYTIKAIEFYNHNQP